MIEIFKNKEDDYMNWRESNPDGFVLNHFGGNDGNMNVLHKASCSFLYRDKDEGARTIVEKWYAPTDGELVAKADQTLGVGMWKRCGVCFRDS
jgi:hypothetical protein